MILRAFEQDVQMSGINNLIEAKNRRFMLKMERERGNKRSATPLKGKTGLNRSKKTKKYC
jgi:hypothetical protein